MQELKNVMENQSEYTFTTDKFTFSSTELKGEKQSYVTGYISVPEVDIYNDLITINGLNSMLRQIEESTITVDYEHEAWRDDNTILPVAKIIEAKVDDRGLWVKCQLNKNSPKYKALWGSIKDGFITAFSIAFQPLRTVEKEMDGGTVRLIDELNLLNVAFTGAPVNKGAVVVEYTMKSVMQKAIGDVEKSGEQVIVPKDLLTKLLEEKSMTEETKQTEEVVEEVKPAEEVKEEAKEEQSEVAEAKTEIEEAKAEIEQKSEEETKAAEEEKAAEVKAAEEKESEVVAELKSMVEAQNEKLEKQAAELKALQNNEVFKSPLPTQPEVKSIQKIDMLKLIG